MWSFLVEFIILLVLLSHCQSNLSSVVMKVATVSDTVTTYLKMYIYDLGCQLGDRKGVLSAKVLLPFQNNHF